MDWMNGHLRLPLSSSSSFHSSAARCADRAAADPYAVLGVKKGASKEEIKQAYYAKAKGQYSHTTARVDRITPPTFLLSHDVLTSFFSSCWLC